MAEKISLEDATKNATEAGGLGLSAAVEDRSKVMALAVSNPPAPIAFQYLNVGPEMAIEMENISTEQVNGSDNMLRNLSPFVIQVEPPASFQAYTSNESVGSPTIGLYDMANGTSKSYQKARDALFQADPLMGFASTQTSMNPEDFLVDIENSKDAPERDADLPSRSQALLPDLLTVMDIKLQIANIMKMPPLVLLINPSSFQIQYTKIQQYQDRSRYGYILHTWGEDQAKISFTAKCGAFISGGRGVHVASRNDSKAWQNMENLMRFYKNNGYIYDTMGKSNAHLHVGALSIRYDGFIYYGSMESFAFEFNEDNELGGMEFNIEFTANGIMDTTPSGNMVYPMQSPLPSIHDPRYMGVGNQNQAGVFSFGGNDGGTLTTQGRDVSPGDAFETLVPQKAANIIDPTQGTVIPNSTQVGEQPVGDQAIQESFIGGVADILNQVDPVNAAPFGFD